MQVQATRWNKRRGNFSKIRLTRQPGGTSSKAPPFRTEDNPIHRAPWSKFTMTTKAWYTRMTKSTKSIGSPHILAVTPLPCLPRTGALAVTYLNLTN
jgi:hypothetical protein